MRLLSPQPISKVNRKGDLTNSHRGKASGSYLSRAPVNAIKIDLWSRDRPTQPARRTDAEPRRLTPSRTGGGTSPSRAAGLSGQEAVALDASGLLHVDVCTTTQQLIIPHLTYYYLPVARRSWTEQLCTFRSASFLHLLHTGRTPTHHARSRRTSLSITHTQCALWV